VLFQTKDELRTIVESWRSRFPWLQQWCFAQGVRAWDNTVLIFRNREKPQSGELSDANLLPANDGFDAVTRSELGINFLDILPALAGGVTGDHSTMISPLNGVAVSEFAVQFATAFLLSSLVRYRPQIWQHALAHTHTPNAIADDATLSLIETFMSIALSTFPRMVEECIDPAP